MTNPAPPSREAFKEMAESTLVDLGAALDEIMGTGGFKAILTILERLEADVAIRALDGEPADLPRFQGQREALSEIRAMLARVHEAAIGQVEEAVEEQKVQPSELSRFTRPGEGDIG